MNKESCTIAFVVPLETKEKLQEIAKEEDRTLSWIIRQSIREYIEKYNKED